VLFCLALGGARVSGLGSALPFLCALFAAHSSISIESLLCLALLLGFSLNQGQTMSDEPRWWLGIDDKPQGPWTAAEIATALQERRITRQTLVCAVGGNSWAPLKQEPSLAAILKPTGNTEAALAPPVAEAVVNPYAPPVTASVSNPVVNWQWPSMQSLIMYYCLYVMPIYQVIHLFWMLINGTGVAQDDPSTWMTLVLQLVQFPVSVTLIIMFVIAGLKWRNSDTSAPLATRRAILVGFAWIAVALLVFICCFPYIRALTVEADDTPIGFGQSLLVFVLALLCAWEIWILIWLQLHQANLFPGNIEEGQK
jgi:hypothetical protein